MNEIEPYRTDLGIPIHAELTLAIPRLERGKRFEEIGVSKDCCSCCYHAISALNKHDTRFRIHVTYGKIYNARLTGNTLVDRRMIGFIKNEFEKWLRSLHKLPDSDMPSSAETSHVYTAASEAEDKCDKQEFLKFMFKD